MPSARMSSGHAAFPLFSCSTALLISSLLIVGHNMLDETSNRKLFIHGLSYWTGDYMLGLEFSKYGIIEEVRVIKDKVTGRCRGFGYVTYVNAEAAKDALKAMNGKTLDGSMITVVYAASATNDPTRDKTKLIVNGLSHDTTEDTLQRYFSSYGNIVLVEVVTDYLTGRSRGFGYVTYDNAEAAMDALNAMNVKSMESDGHKITVSLAWRRYVGFGRGGLTNGG